MAQEQLEQLVMWCNKITSDSARGQGGLVATPTGRSEKEVFVFIQHVRYGCERAAVKSINITQFELRNGQCVKLDTFILEPEQQSREKYYILNEVLKVIRPFLTCARSPLCCIQHLFTLAFTSDC